MEPPTYFYLATVFAVKAQSFNFLDVYIELIYNTYMGEIFRIHNRVRILIWPKDHDPAHVHVVVRAEDVEFRVYLDDMKVEYVTAKQLLSWDERKIVRFVEARRIFLQEKWDEIQKDQ